MSCFNWKEKASCAILIPKVSAAASLMEMALALVSRFEDKRKPPLDIAINPDDGMIEYISYFAQDEMINNISDIPEIINEDMGISICNKDFNEDNMNVTVDGRFKFWKLENTILILKNDIEELVLNAYRINDLNNLLFLGDDFVGIEFKNLNQEEILEIHNSKCLL